MGLLLKKPDAYFTIDVVTDADNAATAVAIYATEILILITVIYITRCGMYCIVSP